MLTGSIEVLWVSWSYYLLSLRQEGDAGACKGEIVSMERRCRMRVEVGSGRVLHLHLLRHPRLMNREEYLA